MDNKTIDACIAELESLRSWDPDDHMWNTCLSRGVTKMEALKIKFDTEGLDADGNPAGWVYKAPIGQYKTKITVSGTYNVVGEMLALEKDQEVLFTDEGKIFVDGKQVK